MKARFIALVLVGGSAVTLVAVRRALAQRYRAGRWVGYRAGCEDMKPQIANAYVRGKNDGGSAFARVLVRDIGAAETRLMAERIEAMDKVEAIMGGKKA